MLSITLRSKHQHELIDITDIIQELAAEHGKNKTACLVFVPHTTAAITVNENADPDVKVDILIGMNWLVPDSIQFRHREGNSDAHIKASLLGASETIPLQAGRLALGTWQGIFFAEFDGPRSRIVLVNFI